MDINIGFNTSNNGYYFILGKTFFTKEIAKLSRDAFPLAATYFPFTFETPLIPLSFELSIKNGLLVTDCKFVKIVKWSNATFELTLLPCPVLNFQYVEPYIQKELSLNNKNILVSVCRDVHTRVYLDYDDECKFFSLPNGEFTLDSYVKQSVNYIELKSNDYLLLLEVADTIETLIDDEFDSVDVSNAFVKLAKTFDDTVGHKHEIIYSFNSFGLKKVSDTLTPTRQPQLQQVPLAFFEALKLDLIDEIKTYLSSDFEDITLATLNDYFKKFDRITLPRLIYSPNTVALIDDDKLSLVRLTLDENKITNFKLIEN